VVIEVVLAALERDTGDDAVDLAFAQEPPSGKVGRASEARQVCDGVRPCPQEKRLSFSVLSDHRSTPQASAAEKPAGRWWAAAATRAATAAARAISKTTDAR
jgi:hypothetical protein